MAKGRIRDRTMWARVSEWVKDQHNRDSSIRLDAQAGAAALRTRYPRAYERLPEEVLVRAVKSIVDSMSPTEEPFAKKARLEGEDDSDMSVDAVDVDLVPDHDLNLVNSSMRNMYHRTSSASNGFKLVDPPTSIGTLMHNSRVALSSKMRAGTTVASLKAKRPSVRYADLGGMDTVLQEIRELVEPVLLHPELYAHLGVVPPTGVLLHGAPGTGKSLLANAIAGELGINYLSVSAPEIVSGMSGESEAKVRAVFDEAQKSAPCLVFIDEIDAITGKRDNAGKEMERRIVAQLLTCMDALSKPVDPESDEPFRPVVVLGATNRPDSIDSALRRAGRFDREIEIGIPNEPARREILGVLTRNARLDGDFDFAQIARRTAGYVGADLAALCKEAAILAVNRAFASFSRMSKEQFVQDATKLLDRENGTSAESCRLELTQRTCVSDHLRDQIIPFSAEQLAHLTIQSADFVDALSKVQPSAKREGFSTVPDVCWQDVGALDELKHELQMCIVLPILRPQLFASVGLSLNGAGALLHGPPGCGKTLVAKAVANQSGASFISIKGPQLLNKFVGESEKGVRQVFQRARASAPAVLFFDEIDALCPKRGGSRQGDSVTERVVNQLLTEMDGLDDRKRVFVIAATNRPDIIDPAMLRPGRLDKVLFVPLPSREDRPSILHSHTRRIPLAHDVDIDAIARDDRCEGFSGADLAALAREACSTALRAAINLSPQALLALDASSDDVDSSIPFSSSPLVVTADHFAEAHKKVFPSVSPSSRRRYERLHLTLTQMRLNVPQDESGNP